MEAVFNRHRRDYRCDLTIEFDVKGPNIDYELLSKRFCESENETAFLRNKIATELFSKLNKRYPWIKAWSFGGRSGGWFVLECNGNLYDSNDIVKIKDSVISYITNEVESRYKTLHDRFVMEEFLHREFLELRLIDNDRINYTISHLNNEFKDINESGGKAFNFAEEYLADKNILGLVKNKKHRNKIIKFLTIKKKKDTPFAVLLSIKIMNLLGVGFYMDEDLTMISKRYMLDLKMIRGLCVEKSSEDNYKEEVS